MQKLLFNLALLLCTACSSTNNFTLDVTFPEGTNYNGKWAYLIGMYDGESTWLDSVIIENNVAKLRANLLYDEYLCELLVEDEPRTFNQFIFTPDERVTFTFDPTIKRPRLVEIEQVSSSRDTPYKVGDVIDNFNLPLVSKDEQLSLLGSNKEFTLIDFWASWCMPCREEIPTILKAHSEFADKLNIVMVSIDSNINNCKQAIDKDGSDQLLHTILREDNPNYENVITLFRVESIPCNVLVDRSGKIVARNLRGEALIEYLMN